MSQISATTWLLAALLCLLLGSAHLLDGPTELEAAQDVAADVADAAVQARAVAALTQRGYQP